jgi:RNA methyltransferase, TrmH family
MTKLSAEAVAGRLRRVEGRHNALVKELRRAFAHAEPTSDGCVAIEGLRILEEAIRSGLRFRAAFFSASADAKTQRLLQQLGSHVEAVVLPDKLFASAVASESPQGVAALVRLKETPLEEVVAKAGAGPLIVVAGLQDPGNLGTILRSAEAFGAGGVILGAGTVSPFNAKAVRASVGSVFRLPVARAKLENAVEQLRNGGVRLIATSSHKGAAIEEGDFSGQVAILVGNEGAGLSKDLLVKMDQIVAIPHSPKVESLNAGVAASIVLYEAMKQRSG